MVNCVSLVWFPNSLVLFFGYYRYYRTRYMYLMLIDRKSFDKRFGKYTFCYSPT